MTEGGVQVSILIRAFNEERDLPAVLDAIGKQSIVDHEVIVVDSGSYDRTPEIAGEAGAKVVHIDSRDFTFGYALNVGVAACRGPVVAIVSAHAIPANEAWLESLVAAFEDESVAMAYGRQVGNNESKYAERQDFRRTFGPKSFVLRPPRFFANNANSAIRRRCWEDRPFVEHLTGLEDIEWARHWMQNGGKVVYSAEATVYHVHRETWRQVRHRHYREAIAARAMGTASRMDLVQAPLREAISLVEDLVRYPFDAAQEDRLGDVFRFRWEKLTGTVRGVLAGGRERTESSADLFFDRSFSAVSVTGAGQARIIERTVPRLTPSEVLVEVAYVGVCGTDLEVRDGTLGYFADGRAGFPIVPGHELSGRIAAVGPNVKDLCVGDRVVVAPIQGCGYCQACEADDPISCSDRKEMGVFGIDGGYAGFVRTPGRFVVKIPDELDLLTAALCEPTAVVMKAVRRATPMLGDGWRAVVVGGGTIGVLSGKALVERGMAVEVVEIDPLRRKAVARMGLPVREDLPELPEAALWVEATGHADVLAEVLRVAGTGSVVLTLGFPYGVQAFNFEQIVASDISVIGSVGSGLEDFRTAVSLLPRFELSVLTENTVPLREWRRAWELQRDRTVPKVILEVMPGRPTVPLKRLQGAALDVAP